MSRLIDADIFKEIVGTETKVRKMVCDLIDTQPTAYDVEKIIEQLEEEIEWANTHGTEKLFRQGRVSGLKTAQRIVRNGGKE